MILRWKLLTRLALLLVAASPLRSSAEPSPPPSTPAATASEAEQSDKELYDEAPQKPGGAPQESLAAKATDPTALLTQMQFQENAVPSLFGVGPKNLTANTWVIRPVIPIPKTGDGWLGKYDQVIRATFQINSLPGGGTFLGDTQLFDLFVIEETRHYKVGVGPVLVLPTASSQAAGQGVWQAGPALVYINLATKGVQWGFLAQNPISFSGPANRPNANALTFQPFIVKAMGKGSYLSSNAAQTYDWAANGQVIPVNIQLGKVFKIGDQLVNVSAGPQWTLYTRNEVTPAFTWVANFNLMFPARPKAAAAP